MPTHDQTFDTFIIGQSNRFAHAASRVVAEAPGKAYNPLWIWGGRGLGKTHLLRAIVSWAKRLYPDLDIMYVPGSTLFRDFLISRRSSRAELDFIRRYCSVDLLLIDDVQPPFECDDAHTALMDLAVEANCGAGTQVVLVSDRPPRQFSVLRAVPGAITSSLITDITAPDTAMLLAILSKQPGAEAIPVCALEYLVYRSGATIQALLDNYALVCIYAATVGKPVSVELARQVLGQR